jgi:hypothetical protein
MISTKDLTLLPDNKTLENICKAISVMDALLSQEWQFRYYSFNSEWDIDERCFQMRNGSGDEMHILFSEAGCAINGFAHEFEQPNKDRLTSNLPERFTEFINGEPVNSIGTTFCLWSTDSNKWEVGQIENHENNSQAMLSILEGKPKTYIDWASEYFEGSCKESGISEDTVAQIYDGQTLTRSMVFSIVDKLDDWEKLEKDLIEIGYPYDFKSDTDNDNRKSDS